MRRVHVRLAAGAGLVALLVLGAVSLQSPAQLSDAVAGTQAADSIINLVRWEEADGGNGHWYAVLAEAHTWLEAESLAATIVVQSQNGYLATVKDSAENAFILNNVIAGIDPPEHLLSLGGRYVDWGWAWTTGEQYCYNNWSLSEPTNLVVQNALAMREPSGTWKNIYPDEEEILFDPVWAVLEWGPLDTTVVATECGNSIIECRETCDDGNTTGGDGCSETCRQEYWPCGYVLGGDTNVDGKVTAADIIFEIQWIYKSGPPPEPCIAFGDIDCSGTFTASDIISLVIYVFKGGAEPCDPCLSPMTVQCAY